MTAVFIVISGGIQDAFVEFTLIPRSAFSFIFGSCASAAIVITAPWLGDAIHGDIDNGGGFTSPHSDLLHAFVAALQSILPSLIALGEIAILGWVRALRTFS